jgi:acylpyruvate hydrolase
VIGRRCKDIRAADAPAYIFGVTLLGDWSIRRLPEGKAPHQFTMGKNFDSSCSLGPCIVIGELDPSDVMIETRVNGALRQRYNTSGMVFSFGEFMEYLSADLTLYPGDMISGGTAAGTAADSSPLLADGTLAPERFLKPGDRVEISSPAIGALRTRIVAKE